MEPDKENPGGEILRLEEELAQRRRQERQVMAYLRQKIDQMLVVLGTRSLPAGELDDASLLAIDPLGTLSDSFAQALETLRQTNRRLTRSMAAVQAIFDSAGIALLVVDRQGRVQGINGKGKEIFPAFDEHGELPGASPAELPSLRRLIDETVAAGLARHEHDLLWQGRHYHVTVSPVPGPHGESGLVSLVFVDISALKRAENSLRESEFRFRDLLENANDLVQSVAADGRILYANRAWREALGYREEEVAHLMLQDIIHPDCLDHCMGECQRLFAGGEAGRIEAIFRTRDGRAIAVEGNVNCFFAEGKPVSTRGIFRDITERKQAEARIEQLAFYDQLTQLPNRTLLQERLGQGLAQAGRYRQQMAVLFLDLDHFKGINDTLGHGSGDRLLQIIADRLKGSIRNCDTVARLGGDEFVILLTGLHHAESLADKLRHLLQVVAAPVRLGEQEVFTTVSIGLAVYPTDGSDAETLLKNADSAMYRAKAEGRNTFRFYCKDMNSRSLERLLLRNDLHRALERHEFFLLYQPQIDVRDGSIVGLEVLARWNHPDLQTLSPGLFIPLAKEAGMILPLGEWVLRQALRQGSLWRRAGLLPGRLSVNLSECEFRQTHLASLVARLLQEEGFDPAWLEIEITEESFMEAAEAGRSSLAALRELGIGIAIDDFGTGSSSLGCLKMLPGGRLKIDRSFVRQIDQAEDGGTIAAGIAALARLLGMEAIAEGVETDRQREFLASQGCFVMQGFHFAPPQPAEAVTALLQRDGGG